MSVHARIVAAANVAKVVYQIPKVTDQLGNVCVSTNSPCRQHNIIFYGYMLLHFNPMIYHLVAIAEQDPYPNSGKSR